MSTTSTIALQHADGTITAVYVHWDGYPSGVGQTLVDHHSTPQKVTDLLALGNISSLGDDLQTTQYYGRDMGREDKGAIAYNCTAQSADWAQGDYNYIWLDNRWMIWDNFTEDAQGDLQPLDDFL